MVEVLVQNTPSQASVAAIDIFLLVPIAGAEFLPDAHPLCTFNPLGHQGAGSNHENDVYYTTTFIPGTLLEKIVPNGREV